jgi:hypothetical protein
MVRTGSLSTTETLVQSVGDVVVTVLFLAWFVAAATTGLIVLAIDAANDRRWLGPIALGLLLGALLVQLTGCASPARDPRDPEIWRPTTPAAYPLPR